MTTKNCNHRNISNTELQSPTDKQQRTAKHTSNKQLQSSTYKQQRTAITDI